jgi:hypothetical protein
MMTFVGLILIVTGFLAELIIRTYYGAQGKKPYVIDEVYEGG